jgi:serine O-acetyltransferase
MIHSKADYKEYIAADAIANKISSLTSKMRITWKYLCRMRKYEYALNCRILPKPLQKIYIYICRYRYHSVGVKSGIQIPPNTFGKGLYIPHYGAIVVNETARFGDNCVIQCGVNVSEKVAGGNHLYLGAGCKLLSGVHIPDDVIIGANAVVSKDVTEENIVVGGIPAMKLSNNGYKNRESV